MAAGPVIDGVIDLIGEVAAAGGEAGAEVGASSAGAGAEGAAESAPAATEPTSTPFENATSGSAKYDWKLGDFKSDQTWQNQITKRGWTNDQIDEAIQNGERFDAPNDVNAGNTAIRYVNPTIGRYVVRDEVTKEILQIGGDGFNAPIMPK